MATDITDKEYPTSIQIANRANDINFLTIRAKISSEILRHDLFMLYLVLDSVTFVAQTAIRKRKQILKCVESLLAQSVLAISINFP